MLDEPTMAWRAPSVTSRRYPAPRKPILVPGGLSQLFGPTAAPLRGLNLGFAVVVAARHPDEARAARSNDCWDTLALCLAQTMLPEGFRQRYFGACCGRFSCFSDRSAYSSPSSTVTTSRGCIKRQYRRPRRLPAVRQAVAAYRAGAHGISRASNTTVRSTVSAAGYHRDPS